MTIWAYTYTTNLKNKKEIIHFPVVLLDFYWQFWMFAMLLYGSKQEILGVE